MENTVGACDWFLWEEDAAYSTCQLFAERCEKEKQTMRCVIQCVIFSTEISMEAYFEGCFAFSSPLFDFNNNCFADSEVIMPKTSWLKANTVNTNKQGLCNFGACDPGKCHFCDKEEDNICYGIWLDLSYFYTLGIVGF